MSNSLKYLCFGLSLLALACTEKPITQAQAETSSPKSSKTPLKSDKIVKRGAALSENSECVSLDVIADQPEKYSNQEVFVEGSVTAVCQAKGCWMTMAGKKITSRARVTFKDYAFFVPKDVKGKRVKLRGEVKVKMLGEAERKHLAEDGRVPVSEIPKAELRLVASGVEIHL